jgi:hypothetical protein
MTGALFAPQPLPVLTLWEPWASLIVAGFKRHETRHWATKVRGRIAIHAAKRLDLDGAPDDLCAFAFGPGWQRNRPLGCVVATANLTGCFSADHLAEGRLPLLLPVQESDFLSGDYSDGRFGFTLDDVRPLREPLPLLSRQTPFWHWTPPADLDARLLPPVDHFDAARRWEARGG